MTAFTVNQLRQLIFHQVRFGVFVAHAVSVNGIRVSQVRRSSYVGGDIERIICILFFFKIKPALELVKSIFGFSFVRIY